MHASTLFASFAAAALVTLVDAHGAVYKIEVAGQTFQTGLIGTAADGPIYMPTDNSPITDVTSDNMFCGSVASAGTTTPSIDLSQGNNISFYWNSGYSEGTNWPHNTGPIFLYMAQCRGDCSSQTPSSTKFIKIEQQGFDGSAWAQATLNSGNPVTFTIPSDLASGNWLFRHEVINLASTDENFPSCSQFAITGGSNDYSSAQTAQFPGAYSASDPGLASAGSAIYSIKSNTAYIFPGPNPIISSDGASSGSSRSSVSTTPVSTSSAVTGISSVVMSVGTPSSFLIASTSISGSSAAAPVPTSPASSGSSLSSVSDSCADAWTACNEAYMNSQAVSVTASAGASSASYTCQTQYVQCVAQSMSAAGSTVDTATIVVPTSVSSVVIPSSTVATTSAGIASTAISSSAASSPSTVASTVISSSAASSPSTVATLVPTSTVTSTASSPSSTSSSDDDDGDDCEDEEDDGMDDSSSLAARSVPSNAPDTSSEDEDEDDSDCTDDGDDGTSSVATSTSSFSAPTPVTSSVVISIAVPSATPAAASTPSSDGDSCLDAWTSCNEAYLSAEGAAATGSTTSYACQTQYMQSVAQSMSSSSAPAVAARSVSRHFRRHHIGMSRMEYF